MTRQEVNKSHTNRLSFYCDILKPICCILSLLFHRNWSSLSSGAGADKLLKFKKWFWSIVEKMTNADRQDLVRFLCFIFGAFEICNFNLRRLESLSRCYGICGR